MSIGVGLGDCILLLRVSLRAVKNLSGAAIDGFQEYKEMCKQLEATVALMSSCSRLPDGLRDPHLRGEIKKIHRLLKSFQGMVKRLEKRLGKERQRGSPINAITKLLWTFHDNHLSGIHAKLMQQFKILQYKKVFLSSHVPNSSRDSPLLRKSFYFEDARGEMHNVDLVYISSWEDLHTFLLNIFPIRNPIHRMIMDRRYLFHRDIHEDDVISQDPGIKPLEEMVRPGQRLRMTIILRMEDSYEENCPKCHLERSAEFNGPVLSCPGCDLKLRFRDSHDGEPDPVTQTMMDGMSREDRRDLLHQFVTGVHPSARWLGEARPSLYSPALDDLIRSVSTRPAANHPLHDPVLQQARLIRVRHLKRVTLCTTQWPDEAYWRRHNAAVQGLSRAMAGLRRTVKFIDDDDLPIAIVAKGLNSRFWHGRRDASLKRFLESVLAAHQSRRPGMMCSPEIMDKLMQRCAEMSNSESEFRLPSLVTRCFLWSYAEFVEIEAQIMRDCASLLHRWGLTENTTRSPSHWAQKLFCVPHAVMLMPLWRLTHDLAEDAVRLWAPEKPLHLAKAVPLLVERAEAIALDYYLSGNLTRVFNNFVLKEGHRLRGKTARCKRWLERAMNQGGLEQLILDTARELNDMIYHGDI